MQEQLRKRFANHPLVGEVRGVGLIAAVEMVADKKTKALFEPAGKVGAFIAQRATEHGLIIRPLVDALGFCPPMIITEKQIDEMLDRFAKALDDGLAFAKSEGLAKAA
jgi:4-aminobutyrate--pyruvate transaminase